MIAFRLHTSMGPKQLINAIVQAYELSNSNNFIVAKMRQQLIAHNVSYN